MGEFIWEKQSVNFDLYGHLLFSSNESGTGVEAIASFTQTGHCEIELQWDPLLNYSPLSIH